MSSKKTRYKIICKWALIEFISIAELPPACAHACAYVHACMHVCMCACACVHVCMHMLWRGRSWDLGKRRRNRISVCI